MKVYGIKLPPNSPGILWVKDEKAYHERDLVHPFPYDDIIPEVIYTKERGPHRETGYAEPVIMRHMTFLWNFANLETAKQFITDYSNYGEEVSQNENKNTIVLYRKLNNGRIIMGATFLEAITDELIDLENF